jgi:hypothetical protein
VSSLFFDRLKGRKNGGFLHQPTAPTKVRRGREHSKKAEDKTSAFLMVPRTGLEAYYQSAKSL